MESKAKETKCTKQTIYGSDWRDQATTRKETTSLVSPDESPFCQHECLNYTASCVRKGAGIQLNLSHSTARHEAVVRVPPTNGRQRVWYGRRVKAGGWQWGGGSSC
jgi:hypothetical protein